MVPLATTQLLVFLGTVSGATALALAGVLPLATIISCLAAALAFTGILAFTGMLFGFGFLALLPFGLGRGSRARLVLCDRGTSGHETSKGGSHQSRTHRLCHVSILLKRDVELSIWRHPTRSTPALCTVRYASLDFVTEKTSLGRVDERRVPATSAPPDAENQEPGGGHVRRYRLGQSQLLLARGLGQSGNFRNSKSGQFDLDHQSMWVNIFGGDGSVVCKDSALGNRKA